MLASFEQFSFGRYGHENATWTISLAGK